jgi:hypothetical protein
VTLHVCWKIKQNKTKQNSTHVTRNMETFFPPQVWGIK